MFVDKTTMLWISDDSENIANVWKVIKCVFLSHEQDLGYCNCKPMEVGNGKQMLTLPMMNLELNDNLSSSE